MAGFKSAAIGGLAIAAVFASQSGSAAQTGVAYPVYTGIPGGQNIGTLWGVRTLAVGQDGNYYGTNDVGNSTTDSFTTSLVEVTAGGAYSSLYTLSATDGSEPSALLASADGSLYGTNKSGGISDNGTLFKYSAGHYTVLHAFSGFGTDGGYPTCLNQGADGSMYGVTSLGNADGGAGTIFKLGSDGTFSTAYTFVNGSEAGGCPIVAADGSLYGTATLSVVSTSTSETITTGIYRLTPDGTFSVLQQFSSTYSHKTRTTSGTGADLWGTLVFGTDGNIYGAELHYFGNSDVTGKLFKMSPTGTLAIVADSILPGSQLIAAKDGSLYTWQVAFDALYKYAPKTSSGTTFTKSLLYSTAFSLWDSLSPQQPAAWFEDGYDSLAVTPDADGNLIMAGQVDPNTTTIDRIVVAGDMSGTASIAPKKIQAGSSVTLSWNFTGSSDCDLVGDAPSVSQIGAKAATGSLTFTPPSTAYSYDFAMQCHDSKGGIIRVPLKLQVTQ